MAGFMMLVGGLMIIMSIGYAIARDGGDAAAICGKSSWWVSLPMFIGGFLTCLAAMALRGKDIEVWLAGDPDLHLLAIFGVIHIAAGIVVLVLGGGLLMILEKWTGDKPIDEDWPTGVFGKGGLGGFIGDTLFIGLLLGAVGVVFTTAVKIASVILGVSMDNYLTLGLVLLVPATLFGIRTLRRLVKVVKGHVLNRKIHNEGTLDITGLAEKLDDDMVEKLITVLKSKAGK